MPVDEEKVKLTAKERRQRSDAILEDVYNQLMRMSTAKKVNGKSISIMKKGSNA